MSRCGTCNSNRCSCRRVNNCITCDPCCDQPRIYYCGKPIDCLGVEKGDNIHEVIKNIGDKLCQIIDTISVDTYIRIETPSLLQCPYGGYIIQTVDPSNDTVISEAIICNQQFVESVTGLDVDNTDPWNPVVNIAVDGETITGTGTPDDPLVANTTCDCNPVLFSHGNWDLPADNGSEILIPQAGPVELDSFEFELTDANLPQTGDYVTLRTYVNIGSTNPDASFNVNINGSVSPLGALVTGTGFYCIELRIKRVDVGGTPNVDIYANIYKEAALVKTFNFSSYYDLPTSIVPTVYPGNSGTGTVEVLDYDITKFNKQ